MNNQSPTLAILGATGKVGSQLIGQLAAKKIVVKALTRDLSRAKTGGGIHWIQGTIESQSDVERLLEGTDKLFLNSGVSAQMVDQQCTVIDIAKRSGVQHIIKLSTPEARKPSKDRVGEWHWEIQDYLKQSGLNWNSLQPQSFMQNWLNTLAPAIRSERKIYSSAGDGKRAFIDTRDIAKVALQLFVEPGQWLNSIIPLSGGRLVSFQDIAHAFSQALQEPVTYISQSADEAAERMRRQGLPEFIVNVTLVTETNQRLGLVEKLLNDNVEKITGDKPISIEGFAQDYVDSFRS